MGRALVPDYTKTDKYDRYFHIYYNHSKQADEREQLEQTVEKIKIQMDKRIGDIATVSNTWQDYFLVRYDKERHLVSYKERKKVIQRELKLCGYFCIITSEKMTASEALIHYKGRDVSEKLFNTDKSFIGSRSMRVQRGQVLEAKIFVEFIARIVRNRIYNLLKEMMLRLETKSNYMTVPAALRELEKIEMVRRNNGQYRLDRSCGYQEAKDDTKFIWASDIDVKSIAIID